MISKILARLFVLHSLLFSTFLIKSELIPFIVIKSGFLSKKPAFPHFSSSFETYSIKTHIGSDVALCNAITGSGSLVLIAINCEESTEEAGGYSYITFNKLRLLKLNKWRCGHFKLTLASSSGATKAAG